MFNDLPEIVTVTELAEFLKINAITIKREMKRGNLKGFKVGRPWRFTKAEVIAWLNNENKKERNGQANG